MTFGERLKTLREAAGMMQKDLADRAGVPLGTLREYEQNRRLPSFLAAVRLARGLGVATAAFEECDELSENPPAVAEKPKGKRGRPKKRQAEIDPVAAPAVAVNPKGGKGRRKK